MSDKHLLTSQPVYETIWSLGQVTQRSKLFKLNWRNKMANAYSKEEQACIDAAQEIVSAYGAVRMACENFKGDVAEFLKKIRTFLVKGESKIVSIRDLRAGTAEQKKAATLFDTLSSTFRRIKDEKRTPAEKAAAEKASKKAKTKRAADAKAKVIESVASSPKAVIKFCETQVSALQQKEKAPFDIPRAIAAWQALAAVYTK